ncbi:hypothetical protein GCM10027176_50720 [Actinoallomurus bryophytorum]|uniref:non-specific serine/threonine protein kinase n=1 Tax=Actinoallomurus bryophytorum TaxID=1490222 RepID=A0A543CHV9_9ACTN|nr:serine/threonine-protein kinase [Actinoallomurus bryophytorum]TQL96676.1 serine/threonine protein kinase [Actinoallomurus bryophytorum]
METRQSGHLVGGRYRLIEKLGAGGFGQVWKASDESLHVKVAVKQVWLPPTSSEAERSERLIRAQREARNAALLRDHPNIVAVHDVVIEGEIPWIVMRLVDGCSLQDRLDKQGPLPIDQVARIAVALLKALEAADAAGIVHRDVKPANVMLAGDSQVLLTDFGIAVGQTDSAMTAAGAVIGSMEYLAPERLQGRNGNVTSDLFSLGATLYQAVEGFSPFRRGTPSGSMSAVLFEQAPPPRRAGHLAALITRLLDKDPGKRPTIRQALTLVDVPASTSVLTPSSTKVVPTRPRRTGKTAVYAGAVLACAAMIGSIAYITINHRDGSRTHTPSAATTPSPHGSPTSGSSGAVGLPTGQITGNGGKCVDVLNGSGENGTPVDLYDCNGTPAQKWTVGADGTIRALGKCMDATGGETANGTKIQLYDCNGTPAQRWQRRSDGSVVNLNSGRCLDDTDGNTTDGNQTQIWDCIGNDNQKWTLPAA